MARWMTTPLQTGGFPFHVMCSSEGIHLQGLLQGYRAIFFLILLLSIFLTKRNMKIFPHISFILSQVCPGW